MSSVRLRPFCSQIGHVCRSTELYRRTSTAPNLTITMASSDQNILLYGNLDVDGRPNVVLLTASRLYWDATSKASTPDTPSIEIISSQNKHIIELNEIVGVTAEKYEASGNGMYSKDSGTHLCLEMQTMKPHVFSVFHIRRVGHHKWRERKVTFRCRDSTMCQTWVECIKEVLSNPKLGRPKSLLVFINPIGGKRKGPKIYAEKIAPLFELAEVHVHAITTERANYALDYLQEADLVKYDGIVCVGGDGMFTELLNGLLMRTMKDNGIPNPRHDTSPIRPDLRIGIIPAGSTDTVVFSTVGTNDPVTSALHIILGDSMCIDCCSISQRDQLLRYSVSLIGYGYYGDVLADSEKLRWMGTTRYHWAGFKKLMGNKSYLGEVSFLPASEHDSNPRDGSRCMTDCLVCNTAEENIARSSPEKPPIADSQWQTLRGEFIGVNAVTMTCRCAMSPEGVSPTCHLGDGCTDLILVKRCSRINYLRHLLSCRDRRSDQFDFDFVQVYRVREFQFRPLEEEFEFETGEVNCRQHLFRSGSRSSQNSVWNCDGEVIGTPAVHVKVHCQLVKIFARGIERLDREHSGCIPCRDLDK